MKRMLWAREDVFYYVTLMNENYTHAVYAAGCARRHSSRHAQVRGTTYGLRVRLLGAGTILNEVLAAAQLLQNEWALARRYFR